MPPYITLYPPLNSDPSFYDQLIGTKHASFLVLAILLASPSPLVTLLLSPLSLSPLVKMCTLDHFWCVVLSGCLGPYIMAFLEKQRTPHDHCSRVVASTLKFDSDALQRLSTWSVSDSERSSLSLNQRQ